MAFFGTLSRGFVYFDAGIGISDLENIYLDTQHAQKDPFLRISGSLQGVTWNFCFFPNLNLKFA